jgi:nicotinamide mononucleotide transporter
MVSSLTATLKTKDSILGIVLSVVFVVLNAYQVDPFHFNNVEVWAFVTGAWSVWLLAKENIWNWPVGIVNGAIFVWLFYDYKLFADAGINMWYVIYGMAGLLIWQFGGKNRTPARIKNIPKIEIGLILAFIVAFTYWEYGHLVSLGDTAPFLDGLTTSMSIAAFYMQGRKYLQNWYLWILADIIYIPLYFSKDLALTGVLYIAFMAMCFYGLFNWKRKMSHGI